MKLRSIPLIAHIVLACMVLSVFGGFIFPAGHAASEVMVVANDSVPVESLSRDAVQEIFLGRKTRWSDGQKIVLATLKEGDDHRDFLRMYVGKTPHQFQNYWKSQVFTGRGKAPDAFTSPDELAEFVANTPGAIGYLPQRAYQNQLKILMIE
ncbi:MAG: substrate-binding domain-containing protein [Deltaproteobacteria bacterium]|jgi:ABC-type phosphate transport system substrate-binding protein|nr:substrate-binding domain-containing protein [Deltaproteobacteria bacterium]MDX9761461.1 substrate-binding domain-containing protein [Desulfomonilia bacterium]HPW68782.1 substrate-binding domain-containing protein [Deltaproteobacteria bacterium]